MCRTSTWERCSRGRSSRSSGTGEVRLVALDMIADGEQSVLGRAEVEVAAMDVVRPRALNTGTESHQSRQPSSAPHTFESVKIAGARHVVRSFHFMSNCYTVVSPVQGVRELSHRRLSLLSRALRPPSTWLRRRIVQLDCIIMPLGGAICCASSLERVSLHACDTTT